MLPTIDAKRFPYQTIVPFRGHESFIRYSDSGYLAPPETREIEWRFCTSLGFVYPTQPDLDDNEVFALQTWCAHATDTMLHIAECNREVNAFHDAVVQLSLARSMLRTIENHGTFDNRVWHAQLEAMDKALTKARPYLDEDELQG